MNIIIFGPQGSGKGTQAELIARKHGIPYISTGDIFRYHLKNETELGNKANEYMKSGHLVPDELTNKIVEDRIKQFDCGVGFILDGYPRNKSQLIFLDSVVKIDLAIAIDISDDEAIKRLAGRLACKCGLSYHVDFNPPQQAGVCDKCGDDLFKRDDDQPQTIQKRLDIYHQQTEPLLVEYEKQGILRRVDGVGLIQEVYSKIEQIIENI